MFSIFYYILMKWKRKHLNFAASRPLRYVLEEISNFSRPLSSNLKVVRDAPSAGVRDHHASSARGVCDSRAWIARAAARNGRDAISRNSGVPTRG